MLAATLYADLAYALGGYFASCLIIAWVAGLRLTRRVVREERR